jgi:p-hydroxybenzoate 3-monooxygenase
VRTSVAIIGAGPSGLLLSHLLHRAGIDSVVLEIRSREHVQNRVRAGVLEHGTVEILTDAGLAHRLRREGIVHHGIELQFGAQRHRIPLTELTGRSIWIYGQQKVVEDLIDARLTVGGNVLFEVDDVAVHGLDTDTPCVTYRADGQRRQLQADFIACGRPHGGVRNSQDLWIGCRGLGDAAAG